jgi:5-formyltetrahydrofolate cyclo-ligase
MTDVDKDRLRAQLRNRRRQLPAGAALEAGEAAASQLDGLAHWASADKVAIYQAADGEVDAGPISRLCRELAKQLFLPVIMPDKRLEFAEWSSPAALQTNRFGIPEPSPDAPRCPVDLLDIIFLPLVGWDRKGGRLGMGGGFYDRSLAQAAGPLLVGLAYSIQEVDAVPTREWDVCMDFVVTEGGVFDTGQQLHHRHVQR